MTGRETPEAEERNMNRSVLKAWAVLSCFTRSKPTCTLSEVAAGAGLSKTTAYRLLVTLRAAGAVEDAPGGGYRLGMELFRLGAIVSAGIDIRREARPIMDELSADIGESVFLICVSGSRAVCLERVDSDGPVKLDMLDVGRSLPMHVGAGPTVLLANNEESLLPIVLATPLTRFTDRTPVAPDAIREHLRTIREQGWSYVDSDVIPGIVGFGVPIHGAGGDVVAALSTGGMAQRFHGDRGGEILGHLQAAARKLSARLGNPDAKNLG
jgi:DNA-binding IclR family transcriptional regulator